jgi:hypothetical protein
MYENIDEKPPFAGTPRLLKPAGNPRLNSNFDKKSIKVLCN